VTLEDPGEIRIKGVTQVQIMKRRAGGVALIYVIVLMSLVSVFLVELLSNTHIMLRQTRRAELVAINRNLQASAWARRQTGSMPLEKDDPLMPARSQNARHPSP
jgi:hypothetical protein